MHIAKKAATAAALTGAVLGTALVGGGAAAAAPNDSDGVITVLGTCGDTFSPSVGGGAAGWTITCGSGKVRVQGWVKDTKADGKAAEVYGSWGNGDSFGTVRAGGNGTEKEFNKSHSGTTVSLHLRVI
ncbi:MULTISPECIES: hypothetical protein [unclassified Saccharopolyspora]|uniref:hypothetical protein n=1 Tax=unclassified Saccharopolyspora TaxID=2646250 RepID=UPI001CD1F2BC|nr:MULTISPECIES: hypothetical protein [unclassified Saccharopolyspora]MCA1188152.1 hypothetical protein [Saccharopolyspora sp. 6T]MCA1195234.1 hypothetical protein [Saccharopolyspora sp. 6V]MCA1227073.1 hypothetical protein [Saccharopolyspora sp. 6M]MCA1282687.1 hypothetical protein [Saccharopolyspora sp. 7B]